ncbi:LOW QUALITY PROTEIN: soluble lamin-associated protein of 75 kDa [Rhynochetos jubatus]
MTDSLQGVRGFVQAPPSAHPRAQTRNKPRPRVGRLVQVPHYPPRWAEGARGWRGRGGGGGNGGGCGGSSGSASAARGGQAAGDDIKCRAAGPREAGGEAAGDTRESCQGAPPPFIPAPPVYQPAAASAGGCPPGRLSLTAFGNKQLVPIRLGNVAFVPLYGEKQSHRVLALFAPRDLHTAIALYLADRWWSVDDIVRTSVPARQGLCQVKTIGERIVLYILNRIIYRTQEMEATDTPFLCHDSNEYAKIMWNEGEAIGFYSVKKTGSPCSTCRDTIYKMPVIDTMFVRKRHREGDFGLMMLEDFVNCFSESSLGLRYPMSPFMYTAEASQNEGSSCQTEDHCHSAAVSEASGQKTVLETQLSAESQKGEEPSDVHPSTSKDPNTAPVCALARCSNLKRPRIGKKSRKSEPEAPQGVEKNALHMSESRLELPAHTSENSRALVEVPEENTVEKRDELVVENEGQSVSEAELHVSPPEKRSEEETPSEPLISEVTEESGKTSLTAEEETADEAVSGESKVQSESQGEESLMLLEPLILESLAKPSEDTVSEEVLNADESEELTDESTLVEESSEEFEKTVIQNPAALASKEEPSGNDTPNSVVTEAVSEKVSTKTASSLEDQNEEAGRNSQETPAALSQSSLVAVEVEGVSFQQPSGEEGQKNQLEEPSEELSEQMDKFTQTTEQAADSSSEEAEIEVPIVDRRTLRRKAKGYKGPPKKKGKPT